MKPVFYQHGIGLVEIMVALVLGLILMAGVGQVYVASKQSYRTAEAVSRVQESGRFAMIKIAEDLRMAGFMGCGAGGLNITNSLDQADAAYNPVLHDFTVGVEGADGASAGPDTISIKYATNYGLKVVQLMVQTSANIKVTPNDKVNPGDIVLVCDVAQGDIFQVTNATGGSGANKDTTVHNAGTSVAPGNYNPGACAGSGATPHCLSKAYGTNARIFGLSSIGYSVGAGSGAGSPPALFRSENGFSQEIAEGVENLQVVYGVDTSATEDGAPDTYMTATAIAAAITGGSATVNWTRVVSARVSLLMRTGETNLTQSAQVYTYDHDGDGVATSQTAADKRIRRVYTATINLRNRSL
ncbi:PilW family protein [Sedimenticola hydrogenitrophicus]|uniref:PilW family protein n=1 Tax=Sedimenticola hydrogenitrophicus TaxID=2967975 RepID=UPI0021A47F8C|nr:PilW family protein [Sedimenticola hydrogenitrophicus]